MSRGWVYNTLLLPCGRSRLLQRRGRVFAFRSCGPGSIPTSGGWDFSAPCDTCIHLTIIEDNLHEAPGEFIQIMCLMCTIGAFPDNIYMY